jgi:hypothetical protein
MGAQAGRLQQRNAHLIKRQRRLHVGQRRHAIPPRQPEQGLAAHLQAGIAGSTQQRRTHIRPIGRRLCQQEGCPVPIGDIVIGQEPGEFGNQRPCGSSIGGPIGGGELLEAGGGGGVNSGHLFRLANPIPDPPATRARQWQKTVHDVAPLAPAARWA